MPNNEEMPDHEKMPDKEEKVSQESLTELEQIEGNYYLMDFFVCFALVLFASWVHYAEKSTGWTTFLGLVSFLFLIRGIKNWIKSFRNPDQHPG